MGLSDALFAGLSGLDVNQTQLNVTGNNIANANTVAFKSSKAQFTPQFYVTDGAGSPVDGNYGGSNPEQRGLGAQVSSITKNFTQGQIQSTGVSTDLAIQGNGFFVVQDSSVGKEYTRDGSFTLNSDHQLVTAAGGLVQGYAVNAAGQVVKGTTGNLTIPVGSLTIAKATQNATLTGDLNSAGDVASGHTVLDTQDLTTAAATAPPTAATPLTSLTNDNGSVPFQAGQVLTLSAQRDGSAIPPQSLTVTATTTVGDLQHFYNNTLGIDTGVAGAGTNLVAGTAANSIKLQVVGNDGADNAITIPTGAFASATGQTPLGFTNDVASKPAGESTATSLTVYDSLGSPVDVKLTTVLQSKSDTGTTWKFYATSADNKDSGNPGGTLVGTGTLTFNSAGQLQSSSGSDLTIHRNGTGATPILPVQLDFSGVSALAQDSSHAGSSLELNNQDGIQQGTLTGFSVGGDGTITGSFDNGQTRSLGQVALATFNNPNGLEDRGGNLYAAGANSGDAVVTSAATLGAGSIQAGALEQSNVDLANEFTSLIISSTGFSAASKVITTSDQMLTDLLNTQH